MINPDVVGISPGIKGKKRRIRTWPKDSEVLHTHCEPITEFDEELHILIADMFATLLELTEGVALTANQVGISKRMFVARLPHQKEIESISLTATPEYEEFTESFVCINPKIVAKDYNFLYSFNEGCLSIPGYYKKNSRFGSIVLEYQNSLGGRLTTQFQGFAAFAVQHEIDHLDGKLFIDGYSKLKLDLIKRVVKKKHRALSRAATAVFF